MFKGTIKNIYAYRHTVWDMAISQLKVKYSGSILGFWLAVINPLLLMLVISFVFTTIFKLEMKNFSLFVLSGIFPWMFFSGVLNEAPSCILSQQGMLRQFNLPKEIIPLSLVLSNFLNFLIGWAVIYPLFIFFNPAIILLAPLLIAGLLLIFLFTYGLSLALAILNVFLRDIGQLLGVLLMFWFWFTPIFYSVDMIPGRFRWIYAINPMAYYIVYFRDVIFKGVGPGPIIIIGVLFWTTASMVLGLMVFSKLESKLLKRI